MHPPFMFTREAGAVIPIFKDVETEAFITFYQLVSLPPLESP